jgi:competence protein ComEC
MKKRLTPLFITFILIIHSILISCNYITKDMEETNTSSKDPKTLKVHFIDVGQGDSILIEINGYTVLIDAGPNSSASNLKSYLDKSKVTNIDYIIATHPHEDHIGGMDEIIKAYSIGSFYAPKVTSDTNAFKAMVEELKKKGLKINVATKDLSLDLGNNVSFEILSPIEAKYEEVNNYSVVTKLTYKDTSFLFMGDAENLVESQILRDKVDVDADILKIGHHGSSSSTSSSFLKEVSPDFAIISLGKNNKYGHPHKETMEKLTDAKADVYRTDEDGTIVITSDGLNITKDQAK